MGRSAAVVNVIQASRCSAGAANGMVIIQMLAGGQTVQAQVNS